YSVCISEDIVCFLRGDAFKCGVFFFFFQAEDGIRDWSVTGVQTCALPISFMRVVKHRHLWVELWVSPQHMVQNTQVGVAEFLRRSEERRVGKEGRSRWSPNH